MSEESNATHPSGPSHRSVEIGVAVGLILFALIVIAGSVQVGTGWAVDGPRAGFFPFYCGLFVLAASSINLYNAVVEPGGGLFAEWGQLGQVVSVVIPAGIYVALVPWIGMYVASAFLIAVFMKWIGKYGWLMIAAIPVPVMIVTFLIFEKWFLVPLPKGPLEEFLGY
jgi:hypothetical protein